MGSKPLDLTDQRFGKITVIKATNKRKFGSVVWICKCDCGKKHEATCNNLRSGSTKSCGCIQKEHAKRFFSKRAWLYGSN